MIQVPRNQLRLPHRLCPYMRVYGAINIIVFLSHGPKCWRPTGFIRACLFNSPWVFLVFHRGYKKNGWIYDLWVIREISAVYSDIFICNTRPIWVHLDHVVFWKFQLINTPSQKIVHTSAAKFIYLIVVGYLSPWQNLLKDVKTKPLAEHMNLKGLK